MLKTSFVSRGINTHYLHRKMPASCQNASCTRIPGRSSRGIRGRDLLVPRKHANCQQPVFPGMWPNFTTVDKESATRCLWLLANCCHGSRNARSFRNNRRRWNNGYNRLATAQSLRLIPVPTSGPLQTKEPGTFPDPAVRRGQVQRLIIGTNSVAAETVILRFADCLFS